jgi:HD superfamily phosphodiesterase
MLDKVFEFVIDTCDEFGIDESHGLKHSIDVYRYAEQIYQDELKLNPELENKYQIIIYSATLHDMCDHKYMDEQIGIKRIIKLLNIDLQLEYKTIKSICEIITTMSHSKVKLNGFADFPNPLDQLAYNIVREADLLTAYDFDRSVVYSMSNKKIPWSEAIKETSEYFKIRVLKQISDGLYVTNYGLKKAQQLHNIVLSQINL